MRGVGIWLVVQLQLVCMRFSAFDPAAALGNHQGSTPLLISRVHLGASSPNLARHVHLDASPIRRELWQLQIPVPCNIVLPLCLSGEFDVNAHGHRDAFNRNSTLSNHERLVWAQNE